VEGDGLRHRLRLPSAVHAVRRPVQQILFALWPSFWCAAYAVRVNADHWRLPRIQCAVDAIVHPGGQAVADPIIVACATERRANSNASGNAFPRFSARRSIPAHAVELKKYLDGIEVVSSTCDNEHTAASLGHSEILGVEDAPRDCSRGAKHTTSVRPFSPWRLKLAILAGKRSKKAPECVVFGAEDSGHVFPDDD
jgi:hypothetical protein